MAHTEDFRNYKYKTDPCDDYYYGTEQYFNNGFGVIIDIYYKNSESYCKKGDVKIYTLTNHPLDQIEIDIERKKEFNILEVDEINSFLEEIKNYPKSENSTDISEIIYKKAMLFANFIKESPTYGKMNNVTDKKVINDVEKNKNIFSELKHFCDVLHHAVKRGGSDRDDVEDLPSFDYILNNDHEDD